MEAFTILVLAGVINVSPPGVYTARAMLPTNLPEETDTHVAGSRKQLSQLYMSRKQLPSSIKQIFFSFLWEVAKSPWTQWTQRPEAYSPAAENWLGDIHRRLAVLAIS